RVRAATLRGGLHRRRDEDEVELRRAPARRLPPVRRRRGAPLPRTRAYIQRGRFARGWISSSGSAPIQTTSLPFVILTDPWGNAAVRSLHRPLAAVPCARSGETRGPSIPIWVAAGSSSPGTCWARDRRPPSIAPSSRRATGSGAGSR